MPGAPEHYGQDEDDLDERPFAEINVTPLVDVVLVLLVIFIMAAPLMMQGVSIELPRSGGASLSAPAIPLIVSLSRDGVLHLGNETMSRDDLPARLKSLRASAGDVIVYVRADRSVAYGDVMDVIGRFDAGGFSRVSLLSQPAASPRTVSH